MSDGLEYLKEQRDRKQAFLAIVDGHMYYPNNTLELLLTSIKQLGESYQIGNDPMMYQPLTEINQLNALTQQSNTKAANQEIGIAVFFKDDKTHFLFKKPVNPIPNTK